MHGLHAVAGMFAVLAVALHTRPVRMRGEARMEPWLMSRGAVARRRAVAARAGSQRVRMGVGACAVCACFAGACCGFWGAVAWAWVLAVGGGRTRWARVGGAVGGLLVLRGLSVVRMEGAGGVRDGVREGVREGVSAGVAAALVATCGARLSGAVGWVRGGACAVFCTLAGGAVVLLTDVWECRACVALCWGMLVLGAVLDGRAEERMRKLV